MDTMTGPRPDVNGPPPEPQAPAAAAAVTAVPAPAPAPGPSDPGVRAPAPDGPPTAAEVANAVRVVLAREAFAAIFSLRATVAALDAARGLARAHLRDHPSGCPCPGCAKVTRPADAVRAITVLEAVCETVSAKLVYESELFFHHGGGESYGDDLREAAALSDRADELAEAEEAAAGRCAPAPGADRP